MSVFGVITDTYWLLMPVLRVSCPVLIRLYAHQYTMLLMRASHLL